MVNSVWYFISDIQRPHPIVANVKYMQVGVGHYDLPLPVWLGVGLGPALRAYGKPRM